LLGRQENIAHLREAAGFRFVKLDVLDSSGMDALLAGMGCQAVVHLAANSDIRRGSQDRQVDLQATFSSTLAVLEAMLRHGIGRIFFASTSAVFGDTPEVLHEDFGPLRPISFYGAGKLAAEAYLSAFVHQFALRATMLRFPNVVGPRSTHGAVYDFIGRLRDDPRRLAVLGDGSQTKPYLHVSDLVRAILLVFDRADAPLEVYHVAGEGQTSVAQIARIVVEEMDLDGIPIEYTGGRVGWVGDVPRFQYDTTRIRRLGFVPRCDSTAAVRLAVRQILGKE
jgi:UDP-glucose 4-epimerase